ncbi:fimbrial protein [Stenotrophomonas maltophilia]|uniref:CS1 type fimbrial major subunit n=1 Tax=Stenotrophomonas maltophilia TaxID=40324 RepID=UPI0015DF96E8|nr:CS1 type fimbrial major subunit [Stenotrophomonas maltophilia]MBA0282432.1 fimbrial protein [Stenotrophomonas maltophilia]MBA0343585.1 fimbrial protein [Stenotrophomonas maltophilia]MBA0358528.1 fimbrial protein [Stenotrophomonas maltophilia]MBA0520533.1 fimbrial protein [Stenotrophomonas maltophilia]MDT3485365.1 CS1 type fimbrial major subunit [Stenotrophomonas maltophilia]
MHAILKKTALAAALVTATLSANAAETHISVWAQVDTSLALLKDDGTALPDVVNLVHNPASGLAPWSQQVRIYTNDIAKDVEIRLVNAASLVATDAAGAAPAVPLRVTLNNQELTVASKDFLASDLYNGGVPGGSVAMPLSIAQTTRTPITVAGKYEGMVSIAMAQKTTSP